jgi:hypothetical protein
VRVAVAPDTAFITTDSVLTFGATAFDIVGNSWVVSDSAAWSTDDISATLTGRTYNPQTVGTFHVSASYTGCTGTALVHVSSGATSRIVLSPRSAVILDDSTARFTANGYDAVNTFTGDVTGLVSWTTSDAGGTVVNGLYTPGSIGTFLVRAAYKLSQDSVTVTVRRNMPPIIQLAASWAAGETLRVSAVKFTVAAADTDWNVRDTATTVSYTLQSADTMFTAAAKTGLYSMLKPGSYRLTVTAMDRKGHADSLASNFVVQALSYPLAASQWRMAGVPHAAAGRLVSSLFSPGTSVYRWDETRTSDLFYLKYADLMTGNQALGTGQAAWIRPLAGQTVTPIGARYLPADTTVNISLAAGWNQISNPFSYTIDWNALRVQTDTTQPSVRMDSSAAVEHALWGYTGTGYTQTTEFAPWAGYFVNALQACRVVISRPDAYFPAGQNPVVFKTGTAGSWALELGVRTDYADDLSNVIGVCIGANNGRDQNDLSEPVAGFGEYVNAYWENAAAGVPLAADIRGGRTQNWVLAVHASRAHSPVTLTWQAAGAAPALYLVDYARGAVVDMSATNSYRVTLDNAMRFLVTTTEPDALSRQLLAAQQYVVANPNPFMAQAVISYCFPLDQLAARAAVLEIFDSQGNLAERRSVSVLPGMQQLVWDATVQEGLYMYRLSTDKGWSATGKVLKVK